MTNEFRLATHRERMINDATIDFNFKEEGHIYTSKNRKSYISITRLLKEMGISPNYDAVNEDVLKKASEYGTYIHSEIEQYCKFNDDGISKEFDNFKAWSKKNQINFIASEYRVHNSTYAGSIDLIYMQDGELVISDIKTTSEVHKDSVSWQLSLYRYLLGEQIEKATCIHIKKDIFEIVDIPLKSNEECEALIRAYENNEKYDVALIEEEKVLKLFELQETLKQMDAEKKKIEKQIQSFKDMCLQAMQDRNLLSVELNADDKKLKITRVISKDKESIDYDKLIADNPQINIDQYKKYTPVKEYVKISG